MERPRRRAGGGPCRRAPWCPRWPAALRPPCATRAQGMEQLLAAVAAVPWLEDEERRSFIQGRVLDELEGQ